MNINNGLNISSNENVHEVYERDNRLVSVGVVLGLMAIVATVALLLPSILGSNQSYLDTISSVGKTEPA